MHACVYTDIPKPYPNLYPKPYPNTNTYTYTYTYTSIPIPIHADRQTDRHVFAVVFTLLFLSTRETNQGDEVPHIRQARARLELRVPGQVGNVACNHQPSPARTDGQVRHVTEASGGEPWVP